MNEEPQFGKMGEEDIPGKRGNLRKVLMWVVPLVVVLAVVFVFVFSGGDGDDRYYELVGQANTAFNRESYQEARELYMEALGINPDDERVTGRIAVIDSIMAMPEEAAEDTTEAVSEEEQAVEEVVPEKHEREAEKPSPTAEPETGKKAEKETTPAKSTASDYNYHIVVGAFEIKSNAINYSRKLREKGIDSRTIPIMDGKMTAVTYGSFNDREEAFRQLQRVQSEFEKNAWILGK